MKKTLPILYLLFLILVLSGCFQQQDVPSAIQLDQSKISQKVPKPQPILDIYVPITEQYKESKHNQSLKHLLEYQAEGNAIEQKCLGCHSADYWLAPVNKKPNLTQCKLGITCRVCHTFNAAGDLVLVSDDMVSHCGECHYNSEIKVGELAGETQANMYEGVGAVDVKGKPDPRYLQGITCADCHMPNNDHSFKSLTITNATKENRRSSCILCHAKDNLAEFSQLTDETQAKVDKSIKEYTERLGKLTAKKDLYLFKRAYTNITFVENDGSKGMHNIKYTPLILAQIDKDLSDLERE